MCFNKVNKKIEYINILKCIRLYKKKLLWVQIIGKRQKPTNYTLIAKFRINVIHIWLQNETKRQHIKGVVICRKL